LLKTAKSLSKVPNVICNVRQADLAGSGAKEATLRKKSVSSRHISITVENLQPLYQHHLST